MNRSRRTLNVSTVQAFTTESGSEFHSSTTDKIKNSLQQRLDANDLNSFKLCPLSDVADNVNREFELMLTRRAKDYSSSGSVI